MRCAIPTAAILLLLGSSAIWAQRQGNNNNNNNNNNNQAQVFGISVDTEGVLNRQVKAESADLARVRALARAGNARDAKLGFVSLRRMLDTARVATGKGTALPEEVRYLSGLTQIQFVLVDTDQKDLLLAGPVEAYDATNPLQPLGKQTGRPVLQFDDLVVTFRNGAGQRGNPFGCSIDPAPHAVEKGLAALKENPGANRSQLQEAVAEKLGPQPVRFFGVPADSRMAFMCVAADYRLKHYTLGLETIPVPGAGIPVDSTRPAGNGFWFEAAYEPLLVSADGNVFGICGPRLCVKAGAIPFDPQGATERALAWSKAVSAKMEVLAAAMPIVAEVQNFADLSLLANLIRRDGLDRRAGLDLSWLHDSGAYQSARYPTPRTAKVLTNYTNGSIVAGGVQLSTDHYANPRNREQDKTSRLEEVRKQKP